MWTLLTVFYPTVYMTVVKATVCIILWPLIFSREIVLKRRIYGCSLEVPTPPCHGYTLQCNTMHTQVCGASNHSDMLTRIYLPFVSVHQICLIPNPSGLVAQWCTEGPKFAGHRFKSPSDS